MIVNQPIVGSMAPTPDTSSVLSPTTLKCSGALLSAQTAVARLIDNEAVAPLGQDSTIVDLLVRLDQASHNRLRAVELSGQLLLSPSHISRTIDRAEAAGFVKRGPDPDDRRASQVTLTIAGRKIVEQFAPRLEAAIDRVIGQILSDSEVDILVEFLNRIEAAARRPSTEDPS